MEERLQYVKVTNGFDTPYSDMFDGVPVTIDPGDSQNTLPEQAFHFFGYVPGANRQQMARHTARRMGWNSPAHIQPDEKGVPLYERMFEKIGLEPVTFKLVPADDVDTAKPIPAEGSDEEGVEAAPPPPKFTPAPPRAAPAKTAPAKKR